MLYDFIILEKDRNIPLYRQIYLSIRQAIENGNLQKGTKLPSIRKLSNDLNVSKTTITGAYEQLCVEGYINNKPQSGYYIEAQFESKPSIAKTPEVKQQINQKFFEYDFSGKSIDEKIININEWKKYVKDVLNQNYLLTSYGEPQGEEQLRKALQKYSLGTRSVNTTADNIVVGAGTQPLLYLLCSLIGINKKVAMESSSYIQSELVFKSFGYNINYFESDKYGATIESINKINPDIILINPNFTSDNGANMPVTRRLELINWAKNHNALIIEDDYNGELRYSTHPIPCVQNNDKDNTVYLGSFSKVLLPSVRISYMVLPDKYIDEYNAIKHSINQTASKTEQLALAKYIDYGKIDIHLRKARRIYLEKSKLMLHYINSYFKNKVDIQFYETSLYVAIKFRDSINIKKVSSLLNENSISFMYFNSDKNTLGLSYSGIAEEKIENGIKTISEIIFI